MALVINSNIQSLNSQRQLVKSGMEMDQAMERLSSGKKINTAADDAAGLSISNRMTSQINGLNRAVANANDGVSLIQTAEGALDESTNILQRMRELAIQSANGIYNDGDRATLDAEVQQLISELDRISDTTTFNGQKLLDGTLGEVDLQVGAEANETISFSVDAINSQNLGLGSTSSDLSGGRLTSALSFDDGDVEINGQGLSAYTGTANNENLETLLNDINNNVEGVTASGFNVIDATSIGDGVITGTAGTGLDITVHSINGGADTTFSFTTATTTLDGLVSAINDKTGSALTASIGDDGSLVLSNTTGAAITLSTTAYAGTDLGDLAGIADGGDDVETFQGQLSLQATDGGDVTITKGANGVDGDLSALGFRETAAAGEVLGGTLTSSAGGAQLTSLAANDLIINGVAISATDSGNLANKVSNINDASDQTGVTASIVARESYSFDLTKQSVELTTSAGVSLTVTAAETLELNGVSLAVTAGTSLETLVANINAGGANHGVTAYVDENDAFHLYSESALTIALTSTGAANTGIEALFDDLDDQGGTALGAALSQTGGANTVTLAALTAGTTGSISINATEITLTDLTDIDQILTDINNQQGNTGVQASIDSNGELQFNGSATFNLDVGNDKGALTGELLGIFDTSGFDADAQVSDETVTVLPRIQLDSENDQPISIEVTANGATATGLTDLNTDLSSTVTGSAIANLSIATQAGAQSAIDSIDQALETINETRSELGAVNNRLDFTVSNLMNISENTAAARSRIMDADFAEETANLSRAQVLQQASQAMLAQANAAPQQVLSLLR